MHIENKLSNYGTGPSKNNLVIAHETANGNSTINSEVKYMKSNWKSAFVTHFVGGGGRIIQTALAGRVSWGAGRYANPYSYAQVELCRANNKKTFLKDYAAYVWLLRELAKQANIPQTLDTGRSVNTKGIKSHNWVSQNLGGTNHTDPYGYLASWGVSKEQFASDIKHGLGSSAPSASYPTLSGTHTVKTGDTLWGIANTHKSTVNKIKALNNLKSNIIVPGQILKLSAPAVKPAPKPKPTVNKGDKISADGKWGKGTTKKLQIALHVGADGIISGQYHNAVTDSLYSTVAFGTTGSPMVRALQRKVGSGVDGHMGPNTIKALQRFLGTPVDGIVSRPYSNVVRALQDRLNAGTF